MSDLRSPAIVAASIASSSRGGGSFGSWSPLLKQLSAVVAFALANIVMLSPVEVRVVPALVIAANVIVLAAAGFAALLPRTRLGPRWELAVPVATFAAVAVLRVGTEGQASPFGALMIVPLIWIASGPGFRAVALAVAGVLVTVSLPFVVGVSTVTGAVDTGRLVFTPVAYAIGAVLINQIARVVHDRLAQLEALDAERGVLIATLEQANRSVRKRELQAINAKAMLEGIWGNIAGHAIIGTDPSGLVTVWNPGATDLLGYTAEQAVGRLNITALHRREELREETRLATGGMDEIASDFDGLVGTAHSGLRDVRYWTYLREDGSEFPARVSIVERLDEDDDTGGFVFIATDETDAKETERLKDEFTGLISHELRAPLSSILGYVELLRTDDDEPSSPQQDKRLRIVDRNARRLLQLVGDLLFTAQVDAGTFRVRALPTDLPELLRSAIENAEPGADAAGVELRTEISDEELVLAADPVRLGQAIDNILSNAVKFTPRGGVVTVTLESSTDDVCIVVSDTGYGIADHELHRLAERFFRAGTATKNAVQGAGLGLAITQAIVTAHGGRLDIVSAIGKGTSLSVSLPR